VKGPAREKGKGGKSEKFQKGKCAGGSPQSAAPNISSKRGKKKIEG